MALSWYKLFYFLYKCNFELLAGNCDIVFCSDELLTLVLV